MDVGFQNLTIPVQIPHHVRSMRCSPALSRKSRSEPLFFCVWMWAVNSFVNWCLLSTWGQQMIKTKTGRPPHSGRHRIGFHHCHDRWRRFGNRSQFGPALQIQNSPTLSFLWSFWFALNLVWTNLDNVKKAWISLCHVRLGNLATVPCKFGRSRPWGTGRRQSAAGEHRALLLTERLCHLGS